MTNIIAERLPTVAEVKALIAQLSIKTPDFVAGVIAAAAKIDSNARLTKTKSIKSPKQLLALWDARLLPITLLANAFEAVHAATPKKQPKPAKPAKAAKPKAPKVAKLNGASPAPVVEIAA